MKLLDKLFKREATVEATAEPGVRLAEVEAGIAAGEGDVLALLEEREGLRLAVQAAGIARQQRADAEYRARITEQANELRGRLNESLDELGDLVPRLLLACAHFNRVAEEVQVKGLGFDAGGLLEDHFGVPATFGRDLSEAIKTLAPRTEWDFGHIGPLGNGVKAERPKLKAATSYTVAANQRDVYGNLQHPGNKWGGF